MDLNENNNYSDKNNLQDLTIKGKTQTLGDTKVSPGVNNNVITANTF